MDAGINWKKTAKAEHCQGRGQPTEWRNYGTGNVREKFE